MKTPKAKTEIQALVNSYGTILRKKIMVEHDAPLYCPLCGCTDLYVGHEHATAIGVECNRCHCKVAVPYPEKWNKKELVEAYLIKEAVKLWNTRYDTPPANLLRFIRQGIEHSECETGSCGHCWTCRAKTILKREGVKFHG